MTPLVRKIGSLYRAATVKALLSPTKNEELLLKTGYLTPSEFIKNRPLRFVVGLVTFPLEAPICYFNATLKLPTLIREHRQEKADAAKQKNDTASSTKKINLSLKTNGLPKSPNRTMAPISPSKEQFKTMWESVYPASPTLAASPKMSIQGQDDFDVQLTC